MNFLSKHIAVAAAFLTLTTPIISARAQVGGTASSTTQNRKQMGQAVESTLQHGLQAKLPPHISTLLGLTDEMELPVMQGVVRMGKRVQGFDVSTANHNDIVIFFVDETTNDQILFLTSKAGLLRKVVKVEGGAGRSMKITDDDRVAFEREKQFWLDRLAPVPAP